MSFPAAALLLAWIVIGLLALVCAGLVRRIGDLATRPAGADPAGLDARALIGFTLPSATIMPEDAGLPRHPAEALKGDDAAFNAEAVRRLLMGERGAYRDAVLLNAAAALIVAGEAVNWTQGVEEAAEAIDKGLAKALLDCWVAF